MQVEITYERDQGQTYPFVARAWCRGKLYRGLSSLSYQGAKADLLAQIADALRPVPEPPAKEVVEVLE